MLDTKPKEAVGKPDPPPLRMPASKRTGQAAQSDENACRLLVLEDEAADFMLLCAELEEAGLSVRPRHVTSKAAYVAALRTEAHDLVLADFGVPGMDGFEAVRLRNEIAPGLPLIVVSGQLDDRRANELLSLGATDFLLKDRLARLAPAITTAVKRREEVAALNRAHRDATQITISCLQNVLAASNPSAYTRAMQIRDLALVIAQEIDDIDTHLVDTTAILSQLGTVTLSPDVAAKLLKGETVADDERMEILRIPQTSHAMIPADSGLDDQRRIILEMDFRTNPGVPLSTEAAVLRVAVALDRLKCKGAPDEAAVARLRDRINSYGIKAVDAASQALLRGPMKGIREIAIAKLEAGWTLAADVRTEDGTILVSSGNVITDRLLDRLGYLHSSSRIGSHVWAFNGNDTE